MTFAFVDNGTVTVGRLPKSARRLDTREWVLGLADAPVELREACAWFEVSDTDPPAHNTATHTVTSAVVVQNGRPVQTWTVVPLDAAAITEKDRERVRGTLETKLRAALNANATYLALGAPTNAQNLAQIRALTRQMSALIRREFPDLAVDSTDV